MSNQMPIYSQVVPKSQYRAKNGKTRPQNLARTDFDPLNYNHGGNFQLMNAPTEARAEKTEKKDKESRRSKDETSRSRRAQARNEASEGKVEAYLRQNQVSIRQQQHRHSAVRQAEHRVNLRSLPLNEVEHCGGHERTPTERHRAFPEREGDGREHRRERERDRENFDFDVTPLSPVASRHQDSSRPVRESSSSHKMTETTICTDKRRFFCREWVFQKIAHCLEQRPVSKTCGALILGAAGSGKSALCRELCEPGAGPGARPQRALARRLLARHALQSENENSLRCSEFIRSLAMQILSHSSRRNTQRTDTSDRGMRSHSPGAHSQTSPSNRCHSDEEKLINQLRDLGDDFEESYKPLLADSEEPGTDEEEACGRGGNRVSNDHLPEILPRATKPCITNPFLSEDQKDELLYENHENVFLRNISQRQSKELRNSRLVRQSSEPLNDKKPTSLQKSLSTEHEVKDKKIENSPPKSRIPIANFKYPNKSDLKISSTESSPHKMKNDSEKSSENPNSELPKSENLDELPEYQNVLNPSSTEPNLDNNDQTTTLELLLEKKRSQNDDVPPPIPSLPVSPRTLIANAYYDKLLSEPEIQQALLPHNLEKNPDECFKKALLFPLLEIDPPKQSLFLLIDAIDEGNFNDQASSSSNSVAVLLSRHQHLLPGWLLLLLTGRHCKGLTKMFTGFRKISLDDLSRAQVGADVQRYVLARLHTESRLRARVAADSTAAAALDHLRIKSDGCLLYLEKVLDGVADGFIALREIREIPGTLNGLYLWLAQRLFHGRRFSKVRLLLEVLLAARCGVTEEMLYKCLLTKEYSVTREDFNRRLHLLRRVAVRSSSTGRLYLFHRSFARWLRDVKHCTRRYLCSGAAGHAALAMCHTLLPKRLNALEIHNYVYHMTCLEQHLAAQQKKKANDQSEEILDLHTLILLWVLDSGCDIESALRSHDAAALKQVEEQSEAKGVEENPVEGSEEKELTACDATLDALTHDAASDATRENALEPDVALERALATDEAARHDRKLLHALLQRTPLVMQSTEGSLELEETEVNNVEEQPEAVTLDPGAVFELAARGDDDALAALLKSHPEAASLLDATGGTPLHCAARAGRCGAARRLLRAGAAPDAQDGDGWSPLRAAAWAGHTEVVEVLLEFGCDVDCVDSDNRTALRAAAWSGHEAAVAALLAAGAAPGAADGEGRTPLMAAAYMGHAGIVKALLNAGADPHHADHDGRTALSVAALCGRGAAAAALLLERGASAQAADRDGATPLLVAAAEGHAEICELLLEAEADVDSADRGGRTALWAAAANGHARALRLLLFWGATVDKVDAEGRTVLSVAAAQGNAEVVRQLLARGLDEHHRDNSGWTPLHYAAFEGHIEVCEALLEAGAKVDEADNDGKGPLMLAAQEGHTALVETLIDGWGAPVDQRAHDGKTAFRLAALEGHLPTVQALAQRGAAVDARDADGRSALYVLALDNRVPAARYLLTCCGAKVDTPDTEGRTPLHVSAWQGHTDMVNLLVKVGGASVEARDLSQRTALHAAAWRGRARALRALLALGASPSAVCSQGATPLGIAAQEGHEECVLWLLQYGADPLQADHCGRTPAAVARRAGHVAICRLLQRHAAPSAPAHSPPGSPEPPRRAPPVAPTPKPGAARDHDGDKPNRANLSLSFAQQVARVGRGRRDKDRDSTITEHQAVELDSKLRSYIANERDQDIRGYANERDRRLEEWHSAVRERDNASPLYASPPRSPISDICSPTQPNVAFGSQPPSLSAAPALTDTHFNRDTHMRIILGRDTKPPERNDTKNKRNGIVTNPAMRLVANVRNGLDSAAANIRRTGVALAASASSANPAVKTNAFQWRKETPL